MPKKTRKVANHTTPIGQRCCALGPYIDISSKILGSPVNSVFILSFGVKQEEKKTISIQIRKKRSYRNLITCCHYGWIFRKCCPFPLRSWPFKLAEKRRRDSISATSLSPEGTHKVRNCAESFNIIEPVRHEPVRRREQALTAVFGKNAIKLI